MGDAYQSLFNADGTINRTGSTPAATSTNAATSPSTWNSVAGVVSSVGGATAAVIDAAKSGGMPGYYANQVSTVPPASTDYTIPIVVALAAAGLFLATR